MEQAVTGMAVTPGITLREAAVSPDHVMLTWSNGTRARFHHLWLRDNCRCSACLHPHTWERVFDSMALPLDLAPRAVNVIVGGALRIEWPDAHVSEFTPGWLRRHAYDGTAAGRTAPARKLWNAGLLNRLPEMEAADIARDDAGLQRWLRQMHDYGLSVVRNVACVDGEVERLASRIAYLRETNFGVGFEVRSRVQPNNVAYTALELKAHIDLPNREMPPGLQFLHCLEASASGGDSILVDGFAAAQALGVEDPEAFETLTRVAVPFQFQDPDWDVRWSGPTIGLDGQGQVREIRYHTALTAPLDLDFDEVPRYYRAVQAFTRVLRDVRFELRLRMQAGDMVCFHNRRVLHGRAAFDPASGSRRLQGCYVDCDDAWSRLRVLERGTDWQVQTHA